MNEDFVVPDDSSADINFNRPPSSSACPSVLQVAHEFSRRLRIEIEAVGGSIEEVVRRNAAEAIPSVCHSHDFVDSNQVMLDTFEALQINFDLQDESHIALCNAAWRLARGSSFTVEHSAPIASEAN